MMEGVVDGVRDWSWYWQLRVEAVREVKDRDWWITWQAKNRLSLPS
jgi:hypothetical protein